jgi:hypothetical protein
MRRGVPQASILGLLQILLYLNDQPLNVQGVEMALFADYINVLAIDKERDIYIYIYVNLQLGFSPVAVVQQ